MILKTWLKLVFCIALSFMCLFTSVGYAQISRDLRLLGDAYLEPPNELYIIDVSGGNYIDPDTLAYSGTVVSSDLTLRKDASGSYVANYSITVFNNTDISYYYVAMVRGTYTDEAGDVVAYSNPNIEMNVDIVLGEEVKAGEKRTINISANFVKGADTSQTHLSSIIEYQFSTTQPESSDEAAVSGVLDKFAEILNNENDYRALTSAMDNTSGMGGIFTGGRVSDTYIGNVVGSDSDDTEALNALFGENMELNIDGVNTPVTIMIKRENVDGNKNTGDGDGNEMTLYITADPLNSSGKYVSVYAVVYTKVSGSEWYRVGDIYKGTANVRSYGGVSISGTGSFNTDKWRRVDANGNRVNNDTIENIIKSLS